eukprot:9474774-Pyramimonas_sp.AAC.1
MKFCRARSACLLQSRSSSVVSATFRSCLGEGQPSPCMLSIALSERRGPMETSVGGLGPLNGQSGGSGVGVPNVLPCVCTRATMKSRPGIVCYERSVIEGVAHPPVLAHFRSRPPFIRVGTVMQFSRPIVPGQDIERSSTRNSVWHGIMPGVPSAKRVVWNGSLVLGYCAT